MMDVRQRGTTGGGGGNSSTLGTAPSAGRVYRSNSNKNIKHSGNSPPTVALAAACMVGVCLSIAVIALASGFGMGPLASRAPPQPLVRKVKENTEDLVDRKLYESLQGQNKELQKKLQSLEQGARKGAKDTGEGDVKQLTQRVSRLETYKERMHEMIQFLSKRHLVEKYGSGPHYVEILLSFDPTSNIADSSKAEDTDRLLIQMAPIEEMPTTVLWFLEQVNATLYDGASFHRNAGHVVQGGPIGNFETKDGDRSMMQKFRQTGLESVPYQEYSPNFPHVKYTLGYAGRPGGPDFYVSTRDNTFNHGPGGQASYEEKSEADPCFAKVVPGYEAVVDRMARSAVQEGGYKRMQHYVAIRTVRLLQKEEVDRLLSVQ